MCRYHRAGSRLELGLGSGLAPMKISSCINMDRRVEDKDLDWWTWTKTFTYDPRSRPSKTKTDTDQDQDQAKT